METGAQTGITAVNATDFTQGEQELPRAAGEANGEPAGQESFGADSGASWLDGWNVGEDGDGAPSGAAAASAETGEENAAPGAGAKADETAGNAGGAPIGGAGEQEPPRAAGEANGEPDGGAASDAAAASAETGSGNTPSAADAKADEAAVLHTLVYNGTNVQVTDGELRALAGKGLELAFAGPAGSGLAGGGAPAAESREAGILRHYAEQAGQTYEEYVAYLENEAQKLESQRLVEGGMSPEVAGEYLEMRRRDARHKELERQAAAEARERARFIPLAQKYPQLKELPAPVWALIRQGLTPLAAYEHWELGERAARLESELRAKKADEKNRASAPGSAKGAGPAEDAGPFMKGFLKASQDAGY